MPAWPVSERKMASDGRNSVISRQRRSGRIGTASDRSNPSKLGPPTVDQQAHALRPGRSVRDRGHGLDEALQRHFRVALDGDFSGIVAADLGGVHVDLYGRRSLPGDLPEVTDLPAGMAAHEDHEVRLRHDLVGAFAGIGAHHARGKGMVLRNRTFGVQGSRHRHGKLLRQPDHFGLRARCGNASPRNQNRSLRSCDASRRFRHAPGLRFGTKGRITGEGRLHGHIGIERRARGYVAGQAQDIQVDRSGPARSGLAEGLAQQKRDLFHAIHVGVELGDRIVEGAVVDLLVGLLVEVVGHPAARDCDDRRPREPGVLQSGGEIGRAHGLRHGDAGAAGDPRVTVRHVGRGLLGMTPDPPDAQFLHLHEGAVQDVGHVEDGPDPVAVQHLRDVPVAGHFRHWSSSPRIRLVIT